LRNLLPYLKNEKFVPLFVNNVTTHTHTYNEKETKRSLLFGKEINYRNLTKRPKVKFIASKQSK
jgi:hypothetical protein